MTCADNDNPRTSNTSMSRAKRLRSNRAPLFDTSRRKSISPMLVGRIEKVRERERERENHGERLRKTMTRCGKKLIERGQCTRLTPKFLDSNWTSLVVLSRALDPDPPRTCLSRPQMATPLRRTVFHGSKIATGWLVS